MSYRLWVSSRRVQLLFVLPAFWIISSLLVTISPGQAHALVPEIVDSTQSILQSTQNRSNLLPKLPSWMTPRESSSEGNGNSSSGSSGTAQGSSVAAEQQPGSSSSPKNQAEGKTYPTLSLSASPLETVSMPAAALTSTQTDDTKQSTAIFADGRPRLVVVEPSAEGWRIMGLAWYWWLAGGILVGGGSIAWRELQRIVNLKDGAALG